MSGARRADAGWPRRLCAAGAADAGRGPWSTRYAGGDPGRVLNDAEQDVRMHCYDALLPAASRRFLYCRGGYPKALVEKAEKESVDCSRGPWTC